MDVNHQRWVEHGPLIKRLYQDERKTALQIKTILESEYGFPETL